MTCRLSQIVERPDELIAAFGLPVDVGAISDWQPLYNIAPGKRALIIHGDRDQFFPVNIPVEMYQSIPRSFLWLVPNGGHGPVLNQSWQDVFVSTVLDFFSGSWKDR